MRTGLQLRVLFLNHNFLISPRKKVITWVSWAPWSFCFSRFTLSFQVDLKWLIKHSNYSQTLPLTTQWKIRTGNAEASSFNSLFLPMGKWGPERWTHLAPCTGLAYWPLPSFSSTRDRAIFLLCFFLILTDSERPVPYCFGEETKEALNRNQIPVGFFFTMLICREDTHSEGKRNILEIPGALKLGAIWQWDAMRS